MTYGTVEDGQVFTLPIPCFCTQPVYSAEKTLTMLKCVHGVGRSKRRGKVKFIKKKGTLGLHTTILSYLPISGACLVRT